MYRAPRAAHLLTHYRHCQEGTMREKEEGEKERESFLHPGGARLSAPGNYMQFLTFSYSTLLSTPDLTRKKCINIILNSKTILPTTVTLTKLLF